MNLYCFLVVEKWTPIVLILNHILQVPHNAKFTALNRHVKLRSCAIILKFALKGLNAKLGKRKKVICVDLVLLKWKVSRGRVGGSRRRGGRGARARAATSYFLYVKSLQNIIRFIICSSLISSELQLEAKLR